MSFRPDSFATGRRSGVGVRNRLELIASPAFVALQNWFDFRIPLEVASIVM